MFSIMFAHVTKAQIVFQLVNNYTFSCVRAKPCTRSNVHQHMSVLEGFVVCMLNFSSKGFLKVG